MAKGCLKNFKKAQTSNAKRGQKIKTNGTKSSPNEPKKLSKNAVMALKSSKYFEQS